MTMHVMIPRLPAHAGFLYCCAFGVATRRYSRVCAVPPKQKVVRSWASDLIIKASPLMDITNVLFSPIVPIRQYLASLLDGSAPILQMLYKPAGCADFRTWVLNFEAEACKFRTMVLCCEAWMYRKHHMDCFMFDYTSLRFSNKRMTCRLHPQPRHAMEHSPHQ